MLSLDLLALKIHFTFLDFIKKKKDSALKSLEIKPITKINNIQKRIDFILDKINPFSSK